MRVYEVARTVPPEELTDFLAANIVEGNDVQAGGTAVTPWYAVRSRSAPSRPARVSPVIHSSRV